MNHAPSFSDQAKSGAFESDEGSGVDAPVFELPRFGLVASAAHASDAGLSELACPEEGAASPARGVQRALRWVGVAAVMVAVAAFTTVSPWPAGGSLSEPVVSPSPRPVAASAGAGAHRLEADAAGEVSVAPAPSPLLATLLPAEQVRESPSGEEPAYAPWEAEENPRHFLTSPFVVDLASSQRPGGGLPADGNR